MRYQENMTLSMIGAECGTTPERIRQIHATALRELRKPRNSKRLRPFLPEADRIYSAALVGNGVSHFNYTWTSSTERVALELMENGAKKQFPEITDNILVVSGAGRQQGTPILIFLGGAHTCTGARQNDKF